LKYFKITQKSVFNFPEEQADCTCFFSLFKLPLVYCKAYVSSSHDPENCKARVSSSYDPAKLVNKHILKVLLGVDHKTASSMGKTSYLNSIRYWT